MKSKVVLSAIFWFFTGVRCASTQNPSQPRDGNGVHTALSVCPGRSQRVVDVCGCSPSENFLASRVATLNFNVQVQRKFLQCASGNTGVDIRGSQIFRAQLEGCLRREIDIDPEAMRTILNLVDQTTSVPDGEQRSWEECFQRTTNASGTGGSA